MQISTRNKIVPFGKNYSKGPKQTLPIKFDLTTLDLLCNYAISENRNIRRAHYVQLRKLVSLLDMEKYNEPEKKKRIFFIKRALEARIDRNLQDKNLILSYINGGLLDEELLPVNTLKPMSNSDIDWVTESVSNAIKFSFIFERKDYYLDMWTRFEASDYASIGLITEEIERATAELNTLFRKAKTEKNSDRIFCLDEEVMASSVTDAWNETTSTYRKLVTGMQGFNQLIGGGFENTRVYLLLGLTGAGKSMTLLNIVYQLKKFNKGYVCKDPTKRPCIVILTMENTVTETIQRLFQIATGEDFTKQATPQDAINKLRTEGELYLTDESPIDILIKFKPNKSEDTNYLYTLVEDLEDEGYETIALVLDHAKRIRSTERNADVRLELGDVINELKTFAMIKDIPVITNSHLNRDAARTIDESASKSKADLTRMLGKSNIGESMLMLDNVDFACIVNPEYDRDNHKWMVCREIKTRVKIMREYVCLPFDVNNSIRLIEDYYSPIPVFKDSMYEDPVFNKTTGVNTAATSKPQQENIPYMQTQNGRFVDNIPVIDEDDKEENIYEFSSRYSSTGEVNEEVQEKIKPFEFDFEYYENTYLQAM